MTGNKRPGGGLPRKRFIHTYEDIISVENLLGAWLQFVRDKRKKRDVQEFQHRLMDTILQLHRDLAAGAYKHGPYHGFKISDPKPRDIHKATVRDRLVHHAIYRQLYPFFDRTFIYDSYSCRRGKGTHKAMNRFREFAYKVSKNHTRTCWVLKCDIRKFFASIDHAILIDIVRSYVPDERIVALISKVVGSFCSCCSDKTRIHLNYAIAQNKCMRKGLPLGNLTSQLLVNVYMNEFDEYVKHRLKATCYIRYADDFVILSASRRRLDAQVPHIGAFLSDRVRLELHPDKCFIKSFASGVDFLGWVHFPRHRVLRTATKSRMLRTIEARRNNDEVLRSYFGLLIHGNSKKLESQLRS